MREVEDVAIDGVGEHHAQVVNSKLGPDDDGGGRLPRTSRSTAFLVTYASCTTGLRGQRWARSPSAWPWMWGGHRRSRRAIAFRTSATASSPTAAVDHSWSHSLRKCVTSCGSVSVAAATSRPTTTAVSS